MKINQWPPINEEITAELHQEAIPLDLEPIPDIVIHWVRRPTWLRCPTQRYDPSLHQILLTYEGEPLTLKEARTCEHSNKWELAMQEEIKALHENNRRKNTRNWFSGGNFCFSSQNDYTQHFSLFQPFCIWSYIKWMLGSFSFMEA